MDIKLDFVPPWFINFISRQLIGSGHKLYQKAVSTVASCDEDYKKALRGPLYVRIREYQNSDNKVKITPTKENANNEILPEYPTGQNLMAVRNITPNSEIVEEEIEENTFSKDDSLLTVPHNQPTEQVLLVENNPFISPEVEQALGILDTAIAVIQGSKTDNISKLQNLLSYDGTLEDNTVGSSSSQSNLLNSDHLLNGRAVPASTHGSRVIQETNVMHNEKVSHRVEDDINNISLQNSTVSTMTKTLRSATRVHGEESLKTNAFHQNGIHNNKESKRPRKNKRWLCCLPVSR